MKLLLMIRGWIMPLLSKCSRAFFALVHFLWRVLQQLYRLMPILLVIAAILTVMYFLGHQTGAYTDVPTFLEDFQGYIISVFTTAFIMDFAKNEHSRKSRLQTQYVLFRNFFNILSDFESSVKEVFDFKISLPDGDGPLVKGFDFSGECAFCFENSWCATRNDAAYWGGYIGCKDGRHPSIKSRNDLLNHAIYQLDTRLRDICILGILALERKTYNSILSYRDAIDNAYYQTRGIDWSKAEYPKNDNPVMVVLINSHAVLEELYKPWYDPKNGKVTGILQEKMED